MSCPSFLLLYAYGTLFVCSNQSALTYMSLLAVNL